MKFVMKEYHQEDWCSGNTLGL